MATENSNSSKKFEEALELLNQAAKEKKDEIQGLLGNKYEHIKSVIEETAQGQKEKLNRFKRIAEDTVELGGDKFKEAASDLEKQVKENPWLYLGGTAVGALLLGFILGSSKNK